MKEKVNAALEAALEALKEAQHRLYCAANAADPEVANGASPNEEADQYVGLADKVSELIDEVEDLQG